MGYSLYRQNDYLSRDILRNFYFFYICAKISFRGKFPGTRNFFRKPRFHGPLTLGL